MAFIDIKKILITLIIATPGLTVYGVLSSAIVAKIRGGTFFIVLITSPFLIPLLIFGLENMNSATEIKIFTTELRVLIGLSLISTAIGLPASAAALNTNME
jgi:heme exporter protein B